MGRPWILVDFESASACDLKKAGAYRYWADPTTEALCLSYETSSGRRGTWHPGLPCPSKILQALERGDVIFVAHNVAFERNGWAYMEREYGWPAVPLERWHDTQARALQMALPAKLDDVLRVMRLPHQKDMAGHRLTIGLSRKDRKGYFPKRTPEVMAQVYAYCEADISGEVDLHRRLGWLSDHERSCWIMSQQMNDRGIYLDMELVDAMQSIIDQAIPPLAAEFRQLTGVNVGQRDKILAWCSAQGVHLADMKKETLAELLGDVDEEGGDDEPAYEPDDWEDAHEGVVLPDQVRRALSIRQLIGSASIKKLTAMRLCVGYDDRARGLMVYHGTTPGRQSAKLLQPHNFPKGTLKEDGESPDPEPLVRMIKARDPELLAMTYGPAVETIVHSLRHCIMAAPEHIILAGDYAGIQARTVLGVAGQRDKVALMASGADVYCDMAGQIFKRPIDKKKDPWERGVGKNSVLGLGFQMGAKTFRIKYAKEQELEFCQTVVDTYRKEWAPEVPQLWYALQDAAIETVWTGRPHSTHGVTYRLHDEWLVLTLPFADAELRYHAPQPTKRPMPWDETDVRRGFKYQVQKQGRWISRDAFGGQLTENLVMKIEREIMESAKKRLQANGFHLILEVHDELIAEAHKGNADLKAFTQIMEDVDPWVADWGIPVAVDAWMGPRYRK